MNIRPLSFALALVALVSSTILAPQPSHAAESDAPLSPPGAVGELDVRDVRRDPTVLAVEKVMPAVVSIEATTIVDATDPESRWYGEFFGWKVRPQLEERPFSRGSGVVIDEEGYVVTNVHVVRNAERVFVKFANGEVIEAETQELNTRSDIALLRLKATAGRRFKAIKFAKDDDLLLGETVIALGNPFGLGGSVSKGILSAKPRAKPEAGKPLDIENWLQTDAAINPGNSGGPLVNLRGDLIGINVAVLRPQSGAQGIGFAIPIRRVSEALAEVLAGDSIKGYWFGARLRAATRPLTIASVVPGSPAERSGLKAGDVLLTVDGEPLRSVIELNRALVAAGDRQGVRLGVRRDGANRTLNLQLLKESAYFNNDLLNKRLGLTVRPVEGGFVVGTVDASGPAAKAGIEKGMFLLGLDGQPVNDVVAAARLVAGKERGSSVEVALVVAERRGPYVRRYQAAVDVKLR